MVLLFSDLSSSRQRKFLNTQIKLYIINENTDEGVRADIFRRVNEGGIKLSPSRNKKRQIYGNKFYSFILEMSNSEEFNKLFSSRKRNRKVKRRKEELITRFYGYSNEYTNYNQN